MRQPEVGQLAQAWQRIRVEQATLDETTDPAVGDGLIAAAADLVAYGLAGQRPDVEEVPGDLAALLTDRALFDDAGWEQHPSYLPALNTIASTTNATTALRAKHLLVELTRCAVRRGPGMDTAARHQLERLRNWQHRPANDLVVMIHGMSQQASTSQELTATWHRHLRSACDAAEVARVEPGQARLAYYADLMEDRAPIERPSAGALLRLLGTNLAGRRSIITDLVPGPNDGRVWRPRLDPTEPLITLMRDLARSGSEFTIMRSTLREHPLIAVGSPPGESMTKRRRPSRARAARGISHLSPRARTWVVRSLSEVWLYLTDAEFREETQQRVDRALDGRNPSVIIGHSLGSVVAMDHILLRKQPVPVLITLGSPLWMPTVLDRLLHWHAGRAPVPIGHWANLFDGRDVVGGGHPMSRTWGDHGPSDIKITNTDGPLHHSIGHYLSHPIVARTIAQWTGSQVTGPLPT